MGIQAPPGVFDIIPDDSKDPWKSSFLWEHVETLMKNCAALYNYQEIRTPIFERTELFSRSVGQETDIVSKEMYTFIDKGDRSLTLRPEGTAAVVRAAIENRLLEGKGQKFFYCGPMFRYERTQAGRFRQFHHFGVEAYGNGTAEQDAEVIDLAYTITQRLGIKNLKVKINSLGDKISRDSYRTALLAYLTLHLQDLSEESRTRFDKNPLRILDSKDAKDQEIIATAPSLLEHLTPECVTHFEKLKQILSSLGIPFVIDTTLVRGLDYYQKTVFEIVSEDLGAHNTLCGGGRYDGLIEKLGGPAQPSTGFGIGIERLLMVMLKQQVQLPEKKSPQIYLIPMGEQALTQAFILAHKLRMKNIACEVDLDGRKVGKGFAKASEMGAKWACAIGDRELETGEIELKELKTQQKTGVALSGLSEFLLNDR